MKSSPNSQYNLRTYTPSRAQRNADDEVATYTVIFFKQPVHASSSIKTSCVYAALVDEFS